MPRSIRIALATFLTGAVLAPAALAGGEPKNESPFTRAVPTSTPASAQTPGAIVGGPATGDAKNEQPFTRTVTESVASGGAFSWTDAAIGVIAGLGIATAGAGAMTLHRGSRRRMPEPTV